jgi:transcriptional regulator with XRE-family HTH domain
MTPFDHAAIGKKLKQLRDEKNWGQDVVDSRIGLRSPATISEWESGKPITKLEHVENLARIFNRDLADILCLSHQAAATEQLALDVAYYRGLFEGLLQRSKRHAFEEHEPLVNLYWSTLITHNRKLLDVVHEKWDKIESLLTNIATHGHFREDHVRFNIMLMHYLSYRMMYEKRTEYAKAAIKTANQLAAESGMGSDQQKNWQAAALLLLIDGVGWAYTEIRRQREAQTTLRWALRQAQQQRFPHLALLANIFLARALLDQPAEAEKHMQRIRIDPDADKIIRMRYHLVWGEIHRSLGRLDDADEHHKAALDVCRDNSRQPEIELCMGIEVGLAVIQVDRAVETRGELRRVHLEAAEELLKDRDLSPTEALNARFTRARIAELRGRPEQSLQTLSTTRGEYLSRFPASSSHNLWHEMEDYQNVLETRLNNP